jgi:hypothetical protein
MQRLREGYSREVCSLLARRLPSLLLHNGVAIIALQACGLSRAPGFIPTLSSFPFQPAPNDGGHVLTPFPPPLGSRYGWLSSFTSNWRNSCGSNGGPRGLTRPARHQSIAQRLLLQNLSVLTLLNHGFEDVPLLSRIPPPFNLSCFTLAGSAAYWPPILICALQAAASRSSDAAFRRSLFSRCQLFRW